MKPVGKFQGMGRGMAIGCDMVAGVGVGALIGWWLDKVTGWSPWCFIVFFVLGAAAGFRMVHAKMMTMDDSSSDNGCRSASAKRRDVVAVAQPAGGRNQERR